MLTGCLLENRPIAKYSQGVSISGYSRYFFISKYSQGIISQDTVRVFYLRIQPGHYISRYNQGVLSQDTTRVFYLRIQPGCSISGYNHGVLSQDTTRVFYCNYNLDWYFSSSPYVIPPPSTWEDSIEYNDTFIISKVLAHTKWILVG